MTDDDLAARIRDFWAERGRAVAVGVREVTDKTRSGGTFKYPALRSDLVDGLPLGYAGEEARPLRVRQGA